MDDSAIPTMPPDEWLDALARSEAELASGQIVPGELVHQKLRESIARIEAKQGARDQHRTVARR